MNLYDLIGLNLKDELVNFSHNCDCCGKKVVHKKKIKFSRTPQILIISLQRINWELRIKNNSLVIFPEILNILNFLDINFNKINDNNTLYELFAILNHSGVLTLGIIIHI